MALPELPITVTPGQQVDGASAEDFKHISGTHRGPKQRSERNNPPLPAEGWMREPED